MLPGEATTETRSQEQDAFLRFARLFARELAESLYRGLLARQSDTAGLAAYSESIRQAAQLADVIGHMVRSEEFKGRMFAELADTLVRGVFRGVLGREADEGARENYRRMITEQRDITEFVANVVQSKEFRKRALSQLAPSLAQPVYRGLLGRAPRADEMLEYRGTMREPKDLEHVLRRIVETSAFARGGSEEGHVPDPKSRFEDPTLVFLHMHKTAGSSLNHLLALSYGHSNVCFRGSNRIYQASAGLLSRYDVFVGHLNYDDLAYIPRKTLSIVCFVREPRSRLLSLYRYWRAHEPTHVDYTEGPRLANELSPLEFLRDARINTTSEVWNHMTWALMGERRWSDWQRQLLANGDDKHLLREARAAISRRLRELLFVGLQEKFDESTSLLFQTLGRDRPSELPQLNSLDERMGTDPDFKRSLPAQAPEAGIEDALERVQQLDLMLYDEACKLFEERQARLCLQSAPELSVERMSV